MKVANGRLTWILADGEPCCACSILSGEAGIVRARHAVLAAGMAPELAFDLSCEELRRRTRNRRRKKTHP